MDVFRLLGFPSLPCLTQCLIYRRYLTNISLTESVLLNKLSFDFCRSNFPVIWGRFYSVYVSEPPNTGFRAKPDCISSITTLGNCKN